MSILVISSMKGLGSTMKYSYKKMLNHNLVIFIQIIKKWIVQLVLDFISNDQIMFLLTTYKIHEIKENNEGDINFVCQQSYLLKNKWAKLKNYHIQTLLPLNHQTWKPWNSMQSKKYI